MRCLYCGKPLPLLKKLTGGGEFCSDAHRHKYQEEYNKLALSRLLQAQTSPGETGSFGIPGGNGLRQLAAPAPPPPLGAQRALPAPSANATAHHQVSRTPVLPPPVQAPPPPAARVLAPPTPPPPLPKEPPKPDPKEAPFLIGKHAPIAPAAAPGIERPDLAPEIALSAPRLWDQKPDLAAVAFDWEAAAREIAVSQEPDPPEAPAWRHPLEIVPPSAPRAAAEAAFAVEPFGAKPLTPVFDAAPRRPGYPPRAHRKVPAAGAHRPVPSPQWDLRLSRPKDWELTLSAPPWTPPPLSPVSAPAPEAPASIPTQIARLVQAVEPTPPPPRIENPPEVAHPENHNVEVFIDLSALGFLDEAPVRRAGARR